MRTQNTMLFWVSLVLAFNAQSSFAGTEDGSEGVSTESTEQEVSNGISGPSEVGVGSDSESEEASEKAFKENVKKRIGKKIEHVRGKFQSTTKKHFDNLKNKLTKRYEDHKNSQKSEAKGAGKAASAT